MTLSKLKAQEKQHHKDSQVLEKLDILNENHGKLKPFQHRRDKLSDLL